MKDESQPRGVNPSAYPKLRRCVLALHSLHECRASGIGRLQRCAS